MDEGLDIVTTATGATGKELDNLQNNFKNVLVHSQEMLNK